MKSTARTAAIISQIARGLAAAFLISAALSAVARAQCCYGPTHENSQVVGIYAPVGTVTAFLQNVWDNTGDDLTGLQVTEGSQYAGQNDCYYTGAPFPPTSTVTGGDWIIGGPDRNSAANIGYNQ